VSTTSLLVFLLCGLAAAAAAGTATAEGGDDRVARDLELLSGRTVFFGHQSVGANLLDGMRELAARHGVALRIEERNRVAGLAPGTLGHVLLAENGDPLRKLRSFDAALEPGASPDLALMKFCYVDVGAETDVSALFDRYQATLRELKVRHPRTTFVHVTAPLTTNQAGLMAMAKWMLGRPPAGLLENARREELSDLLRRAYQGREPLFDLARIESTAPDGTTATASWKGRAVAGLIGAYTDDGGHLNQEGRARAARALVAVLAAAPSSSAPTPLKGR